LKSVNITDEDLYRCTKNFEKNMINEVYKNEKDFNHEFSDNFKEKMINLIKYEKRLIKPRYISYNKKILITLCITLSCIFTLSLNVEAIRVKVITVIKEIYSEFTMFKVLDDQETTSAKLSFPEPTYIPSNFKEIDRFISDTGIIITYENIDALQIGIQIDKISNDTFILDTENAIVENIFINSINAQYIQKGSLIQLFWNDNNYTYLLYKDFPSDKITLEDKNEVLKIAKSIKK